MITSANILHQAASIFTETVGIEPSFRVSENLTVGAKAAVLRLRLRTVGHKPLCETLRTVGAKPPSPTVGVELPLK